MIKFVAPEFHRDWKSITLKLGLASAEAISLNPAGVATHLVDALSFKDKSAQISLENLAWLWLNEALIRAVFDVISEPRIRSPLNKQELEVISEKVVREVLATEKIGELTAETLQNPAALPTLSQFVASFPALIQQISPDSAYTEVAIRINLKNALSDESARLLVEKQELYAPIVEAFFGTTGELLRKSEAWLRHSVWIRNMFVRLPIFSPDSDETIPLSKIYLPLRCFWHREEEMSAESSKSHTRTHTHVASLHQTVHQWLANTTGTDQLRVITGGPGSGKSSFAKAFATEVLDTGEHNVIFIQLQHMRIFSDLFEGIGQYAKHMNNATANEGNPGFNENPLNWRANCQKPYLVVFDGLDELSHDDNIAKELSRKFLLSVNFLLGQLNSSGTDAKAIVLGRNNACQDAMVEANIGLEKLLNVAPIHPLTEQSISRGLANENLHDPEGVMNKDQRLEYWFKWQRIKGLGDRPVPESVTNKEFGELNSEPLLLHLLLISDYSERKWRNAAENKNLIYQDIFRKIFERNKSKANFQSIRMTYSDFTSLLECLGLASWRGNGRTGGSNDFNDLRKLHLRQERRFGALESAELRNVAMQIHTRRGSLDEEGFEFIHKSFGEYLAGKGLFYAGKKLADKLATEFEPADVALDWVKLVYKAQITRPVLQFLMNEAKIWAEGSSINDIQLIKDQLEEMMSWCLESGMPAHRLEGRYDFFDLEEMQINAETALFCVLSAVCQCLPAPTFERPTLLTEENSETDDPFQSQQSELPQPDEDFLAAVDPSRINLQWFSGDALNQFLSRLTKRPAARAAMSRLNLCGVTLRNQDFDGANLMDVDFSLTTFHCVTFVSAKISNSSFYSAEIYSCNFVGAKFFENYFAEAKFAICNFRGTDFFDSNLDKAKFITNDFGGYEGSSAADLGKVKNLTQKQLSSSFGGYHCRLPDGVIYPDHWPHIPSSSDLLDVDEGL